MKDLVESLARKKSGTEMRNLRRLEIGAVLATALILSACTAPQQVSSRKSMSAPLMRLVPQPEGTPLPPQNPRVADHWPSELKWMIDNLLSLYPKQGKPPSVKEVEKKMGITLTERPRTDLELDLYKRYTVSGTRYMDLHLDRLGDLGQYYAITRSQGSSGMLQHLRLVTSLPQSGFCLDPYELAIYTGSWFINGDTSSHASPRSWPPAYVWGMFEWSATSRYAGPSFSIVLDQRRDDTTGRVSGGSCVGAITVSGRYTRE